MPISIQGSNVAAKVSYEIAHELDFSFLLKERISPTLYQMFFDAMKLEGKLSTFKKFHGIQENGHIVREQKQEMKQIRWLLLSLILRSLG